MNHQAQLVYLLGYIKATTEELCNIAAKDKSRELFDRLADLEQYCNQEMKRIFSTP